MRAQAWPLLPLLALACGNGGSHGNVSVAGQHPIAAPADNVVPVHVDFGLPGIGYINGLFATVTLCVPGTDQCQTLEHVLVDTGSMGLRVLGSALTVPLPTLKNDQGVALANCGQFVGGYTWGPMAAADFKWGAKTVSNLPVHIIEETSFPVPTDCTGVDVGTADHISNGILGIGTSIQDCGVACIPNPPAGYLNPKIYYACASSSAGGCTTTTVTLDKQLSNPVPLFGQDNNGTIIELPAISAKGSELVEGALVFGIGTRDNNALGDAHVIHLTPSGLFLSWYSPKRPMPSSSSSAWVPAFIDSGSNGLYFLDSKTSGIPVCTEAQIDRFYCPGSTKTLVSQAQSAWGLDGIGIELRIADTFELMTHSGLKVAFNDLAGPSTAPQSGPEDSDLLNSYFDYGLPFYYGRNVYTAIEDQPTPIGPGPFVGF